jgi:ribosomal protein S18 acetylase RimI-like enzyme
MNSIHVGAPTIPDDVQQIINVYYYSWLATYVNEEVGITRNDIEAFFKDREQQSEIDRRAKRLSNLPPNEHVLVAKDSNKVIGICRVVIREEYNQLQAIYLLPEYQGRGIGTKLWTEAKKFFDSSKDTIVQVATYNTNAINFYEKLGFVDTGKRFTEERHRMPVSGVLIPEMEMCLSTGLM